MTTAASLSYSILEVSQKIVSYGDPGFFTGGDLHILLQVQCVSFANALKESV